VRSMLNALRAALSPLAGLAEIPPQAIMATAADATLLVDLCTQDFAEALSLSSALALRAIWQGMRFRVASGRCKVNLSCGQISFKHGGHPPPSRIFAALSFPGFSPATKRLLAS
jgi:hypothetical protein